jgi:hypothetical protein
MAMDVIQAPKSGLQIMRYDYNQFVRWRRAGVSDQFMDSLVAGHDAAVQMIDTNCP